MIEVRKIGCKIDSRWLWRDLSFNLNSGTRLGLIGATGTGKSLLLRTIAGLDPLLQGEIKYRDQNLSSWNLPLYRSQVMYLHQQAIMFEGTVEANLKGVYQLAAHHHRHYDRNYTFTLLEMFERSPNFLQQSATNLSGGERQIMALIRGLQLNPIVLLLDECTASLDPDTTKQVELAIATWLQQDSQRACIWTSHDDNQIKRVTNAQLLLSDYIG
ncbi:YbbL ABC transporter ATP-binding protein [Geminocystis sp. NIES-3708]|uniref:ABC transporter ATP-binding protein n=1 Tax=Geminocystis sp. NIES-3708 TaxID=1615909 RepID=UPI0005FC5C9A|nr:ATP-binding cassette domain-containing protein [Geminocystis sp. NIES-3708]BAQ61717.1 YbbL ABC transporter ATP-binding protein [Geminocystis sp. NIES-3708]